MEYRIPSEASSFKTSMSREWLLTNSRGDYASGTVAGCHSRRYHGLLAAQTPAGRYMLLSTLEDSVSFGGRDLPLSSRVHPGVIWPEGFRTLTETVCSHDSVTFSFRLSAGEDGPDGDVILHRSLILDRASSRLIIRYMLADTPAARALEGVKITVRPLMNGRNINHLYPADEARKASVRALELSTGPCTGFSFKPEAEIPALVMQMTSSGLVQASFRTAPDWYFKVQYPVEAERGYDFEEDLLMPGEFSTSLSAGRPVWLSAGTEALSEAPETIWERHFESAPKATFKEPLLEHLRRECDRFLVSTAGQSIVPAGYHWFGPWGRDTLIALPGLTFESGRLKEGKAILRSVSATVKNGLVPNLIGAGNFGGEAYNSADASLWYLLAVHRLALACPKEKGFIKRVCWPVMKDIIRHFAAGTMPDEDGSMLVHADEDGLLHVGSEKTQLTWMDASINGVPVTPRHGCAVELNALWFDALSFAKELAAEFGEKAPAETALLPKLKKAFNRVFCPEGEEKIRMGGGLCRGRALLSALAEDAGRSDEMCAREPAHALWSPHSRSFRSCLQGGLPGRSGRARPRLSSGHGMALARGRLCGRRREDGSQPQGRARCARHAHTAVHQPPRRSRHGRHLRDPRRRSSASPGRLHISGMELCRGSAPPASYQEKQPGRMELLAGIARRSACPLTLS